MRFAPLIVIFLLGLALLGSWAPGAMAVAPLPAATTQPLGGSSPYLGEIRWVAFDFAPRGWVFCEGQLLDISQNTALFSLIGTIYGGDGRTNFGLPDLRGRFPMHAGTGPGLTPRPLGQRSGSAGVALTTAELPSHNHRIPAVDALANADSPNGNSYAQHANNVPLYAPGSPDLDMDAEMVGTTGSGAAHENRQPYLGLRAVIALQGIFPSRNFEPTAGGDGYVGEIRWFPYNFAPRGFAFCDGQLLAVNQNDALFSLIGTTYGGDGTTTFALPDLRGRVPVHQGQGPGLSSRPLGQKGGQESVALTAGQMPAHTHALHAVDARGDSMSPADKFPGSGRAYHAGPPVHTLADSALASTGGGQPHTNMAPYQAIHACISLVGIYPSRNLTGAGGEGFIGEVRWVAFNFAPRGWAYCDGNLLPISTYASLYSLLGNIFGGQSPTSFALPDLRGRAPIHPDGEISIGKRGGQEDVTLAQHMMPSHTHQARGTSAQTASLFPAEDLLATSSNVNPYVDSTSGNPPLVDTWPSSKAGAGLPHPNMQPYAVIGACIILEGLFPPRD